MKLVTAFLEYLTVEKNYSLHTVKAYQKDICDFFEYVRGEYEIVIPSEVGKNEIRSWVVVLNEQNIQNRSINRKITSLKSFFTYLQRVDEVEENPVKHQKSLKTSKKVILPFTEKEIEEAMLIEDTTITQYEQYRNKTMIHLLYATGIRQAELMGLTLDRVDLKEKKIKVLGKRNKERIIPIYDELVKDLEFFLDERMQIASSENYFFVTQKGGKLYNALVYRVINSYFGKVTTKQKKSPHVLRHSYATDLVDNGADLNSVKSLLGHSSLAATQVYTHSGLDKLKQVYKQAHPRSAKKK